MFEGALLIQCGAVFPKCYSGIAMSSDKWHHSNGAFKYSPAFCQLFSIIVQRAELVVLGIIFCADNFFFSSFSVFSSLLKCFISKKTLFGTSNCSVQ